MGMGIPGAEEPPVTSRPLPLKGTLRRAFRFQGGRWERDQETAKKERVVLRKSSCLILLMLVLLTGCTMIVKRPEVTVKDVNVVSLDGGGAGMEVYLGVKNMNPYDLKLLGYNYDLKVMALPLAKGGARETVVFPSKAETDIRIPIRVSFADLLEILKRGPNPDSIPYQLFAGLDLDTPLGEMTVPVHRTGTYAIPEKYRPSSFFNKLGDLFR